MSNGSLYILSETVPNWIMALSAASAAVVFLWRRQDRRESQEQRDERIRNGVHAHWATIEGSDPDKPRWGVIVTVDLASPVDQLEVSCSNNGTPKAFSTPRLPPGAYFFESVWRNGHPAWNYPEQAPSVARPILDSRGHTVQNISFRYSGRAYSQAPQIPSTT